MYRIEWTEVSQKRSEIKNETQTTNCTGNSVVYLNNETSVNISSPGFPYGYDVNLDCTWILKPDAPGYVASFTFLEIDLEDTTNCLSDYVEVSSSSDLSTYKVLNKTCQVIPNVVTQMRGDPYLKLHFISDYYTNRTGFLGLATVRCGGPMTGPSGIITFDSKEQHCQW